MVIEFLTFNVPAEMREKWKSLDNEIWTTFLATQEGFVKKELWQSSENDGEFHAVIWWKDKQSWAAISSDQITKVDKGMGEFLITPKMKEFLVLKEYE
ncbi:MAG: TIGR03792 family protein [Acidimicrobiaceae bacterium]|nr:TIGR03792 family protein [Acidimicrobiaceae bacterium]